MKIEIILCDFCKKIIKGRYIDKIDFTEKGPMRRQYHKKCLERILGKKVAMPPLKHGKRHLN